MKMKNSFKNEKMNTEIREMFFIPRSKYGPGLERTVRVTVQTWKLPELVLPQVFARKVLGELIF